MSAGTKDDPWQLKTPPLSSDYEMYRDERDGTKVIVCTVGKTTLLYDARAIDDLHAMLVAHGDWIELGSADEQKPAEGGHRRGVGPLAGQPGRRLVRPEEGPARPVRDVHAAAARGARQGRGRAQPAQQPHARDVSGLAGGRTTRPPAHRARSFCDPASVAAALDPHDVVRSGSGVLPEDVVGRVRDLDHLACRCRVAVRGRRSETTGGVEPLDEGRVHEPVTVGPRSRLCGQEHPGNGGLIEVDLVHDRADGLAAVLAPARSGRRSGVMISLPLSSYRFARGTAELHTEPLHV